MTCAGGRPAGRPPAGSFPLMKTTTRLAGIELRDWQEKPVRLGSLWEERPVVLVFIRHFG